MPTQPITVELETSDPGLLRLERHSYVNLINVVHAELQLVERMIDAPGSLRSAINLAEAASRAFKEVRVTRRHLHELVRFADLIESDLHEMLEEAGAAGEEDDVREAAAILLDVLPDAHLRVQEVISRHGVRRPPREYEWSTLETLVGERGGEIDREGDGRRLTLPEGLEHALRQAVSAERPTRVERVRIDAGEPVRVTMNGVAAHGSLDPLLRRLRPSELHGEIATAGATLRGIALLCYYTAPDGAVLLERSDDPGDSRFVVTAELAAPELADDSD